MPHVVTVSQNGSIKCDDKSCKHYKKEHYCAHVLSVEIEKTYFNLLLIIFSIKRNVFKRCSVVECKVK